MDYKKMREEFRSKMNDIQDFVADNGEITSAAEVVRDVISVVAEVQQARLGGGIAVLGAVASGASSFFLDARGGRNDRFRRWTKRNGLVSAPSTTKSIMSMFASQYGPRAFERVDILDTSNEDSQSNFAFIRAKFDADGKPIIAYLAAKADGHEYIEDELVGVCQDEAAVTKVLRSLVGKHVTIRPITGGDSPVSIQELDYAIPPGHMFDKDTVETIKQKIKVYRENNASFAACIVGPPGNGKSTFCLALAVEMGASILTIYPETLREFQGDHQLTEIVTNLGSEIVVFEDLDRVGDDYGSDSKLLGILDILRKKSPKTIVLSTANNKMRLSAALRRPGRLGPEFNLEPPDLDKRTKILNDYAKMFGVKRDISHLTKHMVHENFTFDFIRDVARQALVEDDAYLVRYIKGLTREFERENARDSRTVGDDGDSAEEDEPAEQGDEDQGDEVQDEAATASPADYMRALEEMRAPPFSSASRPIGPGHVAALERRAKFLEKRNRKLVAAHTAVGKRAEKRVVDHLERLMEDSHSGMAFSVTPEGIFSFVEEPDGNYVEAKANRVSRPLSMEATELARIEALRGKTIAEIDLIGEQKALFVHLEKLRARVNTTSVTKILNNPGSSSSIYNTMIEVIDEINRNVTKLKAYAENDREYEMEID